MKIFTLSFLICIFCSCQPTANPSQVNVYFDLKDLIKKEINFIAQSNLKFYKTVKINERLEIKRISNKSYISDLKSFMEYDLNKASWKNSFQISNNHYQTIYTGKEDAINTKKMIIDKNPVTGIVSKIRIIYRNDNNLFKTHKVIDIIPGKGYSICITQDVIGIDNELIYVRVSI